MHVAQALVIGRQTYKWLLWDMVFHENNSSHTLMERGNDLLILVPVPSKFDVDHVITFVLEYSILWPTANGSMSPRIWFPNVDYLKLWEKGETRLNSILIIIIRGNRNIKVVFMEEHILIRPDRSLLLLNGLYGMWSSWNNSMIFFHYFSLNLANSGLSKK